MKRVLKSQKGLTLIEVIIAASIAIVISMGVMKITENANRGVRKVETDAELRDFQNILKNFMTDGETCANSFRGYYSFANGAGNGNLSLNLTRGQDTSNKNVATSGNGLRPPLYDASTSHRFYEFSNNTSRRPNPMRRFRFAKKTRNGLLDHPTPGAILDDNIIFTPDQFLSGADTWNLLSLKVFDQDPSTNLCAMHFTVARNNNINSVKKSTGVSQKSFWIYLSCIISPADNGVEYCTPSDSVQTGHWTLENGNPSNGMTPKGVTGPVILRNQNLEIRGNGGVILDSDKRFKKDESIITEVSEKLEHINGYYYFMRNNEFPERRFSNELQLGVFAQEIESQFDGIVTTKSDGFKALDYNKLIPVLIQAHKEQEAKIQKQQVQINELKKVINSILHK